MSERRYPVLLAGTHYSPEFQCEAGYAQAWKSVLERNYGHHATCLCPGKGERKLSIRRRDDSDQLHLARFPGTGMQHANECRFYAPAPERSGMQGYAKGVVEESENGLRVRLARGLRVRAASTAEPVEVNRANAAGARQPAVTLLGLLHLLWTEARLNVWYPSMHGKRNTRVVSHALNTVAERITANRMPLSSVLLLPAVKASADEARNRARSMDAWEQHRRLVVVSPLARFDQERHGRLARLPTAGPFGMPFLWLPRGAAQSMQHSFGRELGAWRRGERVVAIAQLNPREGASEGSWEVAEVALMRVTERWIPVASDYEAMIEALLCQEGRSFDKPLRFDSADDVFFPDFWLIDSPVDFPMEVFGMDTPDYRARNARKRAWLDREFGPRCWWHWDAAADPHGEAIPSFPPARVKREA